MKNDFPMVFINYFLKFLSKLSRIIANFRKRRTYINSPVKNHDKILSDKSNKKLHDGMMYCDQCGTEISNNANFCYNCGNKVSSQ